MRMTLACALIAGAAAVGLAQPAAAVPAAPVPIHDTASADVAQQVRTVCWWRHGRRVCSWQPSRHRGWDRGWHGRNRYGHGHGRRW